MIPQYRPSPTDLTPVSCQSCQNTNRQLYCIILIIYTTKALILTA